MGSKDYYVYVYLNPLSAGVFTYEELSFNYEPFYVGKGKGNRMYNHVAEAKFRNKTDKHRLILEILSKGFNPYDYIVKLYCEVSEEEAFALEVLTIRTIGRTLIQAGPLLNKHFGGNGSKGKLCKFSDEERKSIALEYLAGLTTTQLGIKYRVDHKTICNILKDTNTSARKVRSFNLAEKFKISEKYLSGDYPIAKLAKDYGVSYRVLRNLLVEQGVKIKRVYRKK